MTQPHVAETAVAVDAQYVVAVAAKGPDLIREIDKMRKHLKSKFSMTVCTTKMAQAQANAVVTAQPPAPRRKLSKALMRSMRSRQLKQLKKNKYVIPVSLSDEEDGLSNREEQTEQSQSKRSRSRHINQSVEKKIVHNAQEQAEPSEKSTAVSSRSRRRVRQTKRGKIESSNDTIVPPGTSPDRWVPDCELD